jgi:hypothetical protein
MFQELDLVVLNRDFPEYGLKEGDIGSIVHCYQPHDSYEVEFVNARGETIALLTLTLVDIRAMDGLEILHVRALRQAAA